MADKSAASKAAEKHGWTLLHEQEARSEKTGDGVFVVADAAYTAHKRHNLGTAEVSANTPEQLVERIEEWENTHAPAETQPTPTREQVLNEAKATVASLVTAGARPAADVNLTGAAEKAKPEAVNLSVPPVIEETKLSADDAALVVEATTPAGT